MSARRALLSVVLWLLAGPALAQAQGQGQGQGQGQAGKNIVMQPMIIRPDVELLSPTNGAQFVTGQTVVFDAFGSPGSGDITAMDLYLDGSLYAHATTAEITVNWTATLGTHTVWAKATDQGSSRTSPTATITVVANTPPSVSLTAPANGTTPMAGATVSMTASASDTDGSINRVEFLVDGALAAQDNSSPYAYNWTATAGSHTLQARAVDNANGTTTSASVGIYGNVAPTVGLTSPANGAVYTVGASVPLSANASDSYGGSIDHVEFWIDGTMVCQDAASPYACNWTATAGAHGVSARAVDNLGVATTSSAVTITGNVLPSVSLTSPANGAVYMVGAAVPMAATASDSGGSINRVEFWVDGALAAQDSSSPYAYNWTATAGSHTMQAKAVDNLGASTTTSAITITGNIAPTVSLTSPANGAVYTVGASVPLAATASDSGGSINHVEFWVDGTKVADDASSPYAYNWTATAGSHSVLAKAVDNLGATTTTASVSITGNVLPTVSLTSPANGAVYMVGVAVPLAANASDSGGSINHVEFWVDGTKVNDDSSSPYAYNWTATAGSHSVLAKAVDNLGATTSTAAVTITGNVAPTVSLTGPANGAVYVVGSAVPLSANASDSGGSIDHVEFWVDGAKVFDDTGSPYAYNWTATAGSHSVLAKAVDNLGATTNSSTVTITGNVLPTVSLTSPANGAVYMVGAAVPLAANASDSGGSIDHVEFWVDGTKVVDDASSPYAYNWTATAGSHSVLAKAVDNLGATTTTSAVSITGNVAPTVSLTGPANGAIYVVGSAVPLSANAGDSGGSIDHVEFWVDGTKVADDASSPYAYNWSATVGSHSVLAKAVDNLGATTTTSSVSITGNALPSVTLTSPASGAVYTTGDTVPMAATASDSGGNIARVEFWVDGAKIVDDTVSPYAYDWTATIGNHTLQARAVDNLGAATTTPTISITGIAPTNNAEFVGQSVPTTMIAGLSYTVGVTMKNLGTTTWTSSGAYRLGSFNPNDNTRWGLSRVGVPSTIAPGQSATFSFVVTAPATPGNYSFQWRMVQEAIEWFGAATTDVTVAVSAASPSMVTRTYAYNAHQELCRVQEPETGATLMGYDGAGNLSWSASGLPTGTNCDDEGDTTDILARKAARTYDARNRISTLSFPDLNGNQSWSYTPDGLPASVTTYNDAGATTVINSYAYNRRRILTDESSGQPGWYTWWVSHDYDANGHLSRVTNPDTFYVDYAPNALGQPTQAGPYATSVQYYPNGAIKQFTYGNGIVHTLTQNARGLPDVSQDAYGATAIHRDEYAYDQVGNVLSITDAATGQNQRGNRDMVYDAANRLTNATSPMFGTAAYTYDVLDNLIRVQVTGGNQARNQDYFYDGNNRLTNITSGGATVVGLGYDVQGNLANKSGVSYTFDYGNRLRGVGSLEGYRYDAGGRRALAWSPTAGTILSMYGQDGVLRFQENQRLNTNLDYVYLGGSLVAIRSQDTSTTVVTIKYQHTDALGSPVAVTDANKTVLQRSEYEPYGYLLNRPMEDGPGYTGHVTDAATGLVYMQQRYYDPLCGCFLSVDPATAYSPGGVFNQYWYANANPYGLVDPDGREAACVTMQVNCFDSGGTFGEKAGMLTSFAVLMTGGMFAPGAIAAAGELLGGRVAQQTLSNEAKRGIRSLEKQIAKHLKKLEEFKENPTVRPGMENLPEDVIKQQQQRRIEHLEQEIKTFLENIEKLKKPPPPPTTTPPPPPPPPPPPTNQT